MKIVAISQRMDFISDRNEWRDALDQRLNLWLLTLGYIPVPVPNGLNKLIHNNSDGKCQGVRSWVQTIQPNAVVLSGGNDLGECQDRDDTERCLLMWAREQKLPVLGICRGMQMMGVWAGETLKPVSGHVQTRHILRGKLQGEVNSYHNFALKNCPSDFEILAQSEDGEIEAIRHVKLPWEGWMWHPERESDIKQTDNSRLKVIFGE